MFEEVKNNIYKWDLVLWYKPLNSNYRFNKNEIMPFKTCLRYNEMWDTEWTQKEINETRTDLIVCHHKNDYLRYKSLYKNDPSKEFVYIPHFSNPNIFHPMDVNRDIDILISGVTKEKHYPLKYRLYNLIKKHQNTTLCNFKIHFHKHPSYSNMNSFENVNQIEYNHIINRSKLCISCTSKYNYRLGKYVEIPMAGGVILGDLPFEDERFKDFTVEVNLSMSDDEILNIIKNTLINTPLIDQKRKIGLEWSSIYNQNNYIYKNIFF